MKARWFICPMALLIIAFSTSGLWSHDENETQTTDHAATETDDGLRLELNLTPEAASVGKLATLRASFKRNGEPAGPVMFKLIFWHVEDEKEVFHTRFLAPDATVEWRHQFYDGAPHRVTLIAQLLSEGAIPVQVQMNIDVHAIQPPTAITVRTMLFLLGVTALSMAIGFAGAVKLSTFGA